METLENITEAKAIHVLVTSPSRFDAPYKIEIQIEGEGEKCFKRKQLPEALKANPTMSNVTMWLSAVLQCHIEIGEFNRDYDDLSKKYSAMSKKDIYSASIFTTRRLFKITGLDTVPVFCGNNTIILNIISPKGVKLGSTNISCDVTQCNKISIGGQSKHVGEALQKSIEKINEDYQAFWERLITDKNYYDQIS